MSFWIRSRWGRERPENIAKAAPGGGRMAKRRLVRAGVVAVVALGVWWIGAGQALGVAEIWDLEAVDANGVPEIFFLGRTAHRGNMIMEIVT